MIIASILFIAGLAAWFISTIAAGGAAMLMIPLVALLLGPQTVAPAISLGAFLANPSRAWLFRHSVDWQVCRWMIPGSLCGAILGAWTFSQIPVFWIQLALALFLISTVFQYRFGKSSRSFKMRRQWFFPLGLGVAFLSALVGGTGPVQNPFLLNYGLQKEQLIATKAINSLILQLTKLLAYTGFGAMTLEIAGYGLVIGLGGALGVWCARHHLKNVDEHRFRVYTLTLMPICGVVMLLDAFF
ncbi:sulfite exporter TauE/SafE family protein [uncultured Porticoccus sp.]|uniref:sulfite exporter TauE/SafE family protein n=1 Tax=uncultured Porticoccus sp. TaxID=1256050 RepID=UPI0030DA938D|tara:strand:- start:11044 stop:11772 length:729 start_codon:yes stop_codon:yes gene_type:complete